MDILEIDHVLARSRGGLELESHRLPPLGRLDTLDFVQLLDPALHLRGMGGTRLEAFDELDFLGKHRLLPFELRLLLLFVLGALPLVKLVVAGNRW